VSEISPFETGFLEDGVEERRNPSDYYLNGITWYMGGGALNAGFRKTEDYEYNAR